MIYKLAIFELKKNLFHSRDWLNNAIFLLVNMAIFPFTISPNLDVLNQLFLSAIMTSMLLGIVLTTNHIFDEDASDGSLDQYLVSGVTMPIIYLSRVIAVSIEFALVLSIVFPALVLLYAIDFSLLIKIWILLLLSIPILTSIGIFGSLLTINLRKSSAVSILLIFPLLISALIILSLASGRILATAEFSSSLAYMEMNLGFTMLLVPVLCWLTKYLR